MDASTSLLLTPKQFNTVDQSQFEFELDRRSASIGPTLSYAGSVSTLMARPEFLQYPAYHRPIWPTPLA